MMQSIREVYVRTGYADATNCAFDCTGQVMLTTGREPPCFNLIDHDFPYTLNFFDLTSLASVCPAGSRVRVRGHVRPSIPAYTRNDSAETTVCITNLEFLGIVPFPETEGIQAPEITALTATNRFVHIDGVMSDIVRDPMNDAWNWIRLRTPDGTVQAAVTDHCTPYPTFKLLLDAEVRLRGIVHEPPPGRKFLSPHLILFGGTNGIQTLRPAPAPFDAPRLTGQPTPHRQQTTGRVSGHGVDRFFLVDDSARFFQILLPQDSPTKPMIGDRVTVSGFASRGPIGYILSSAVFKTKPAEHLPLEEPRDITLDQLFLTTAGNTVADTSILGKLVRLQGRIANQDESIRTEGRIILDCGRRTITVNVAHLPTTDLDENSRLQVTGLCLADFEMDIASLSFPPFKGLVLFPRTADDLRLIERPPW